MPPHVVRRADPSAVAEILATLPEWFGIPEAKASYVDDAGRLPSYLAVDGDDVVGVVLLAEHFPEARELHLLAVRRDRRGRGIGRMLVEAVASDLREAGVRVLEVHTVGPSYEDAGYAQTREFYLATGFVAMNELPGIDWSGPTLILVRPL
ncbi:MAG: GNAT family N-acetyltransferase [Nocardioides sp.]